jgi:RND family efflux transporter MFP subunit
MPPLTNKIPKFFKSKWTIGIIVIIVLLVGYHFIAGGSKPASTLITVTKGSITEVVSATGNTTPMQSVSLSFPDSGTIARVNYQLGAQVSAGDVIAGLDTGQLSAALDEAQASLAVAQANLASLTAGTSADQLAIDQNTVTQDEVALANAVASAYAAADTAVYTDADQIFTNARTTSATLTIDVPDDNLVNEVTQERIALEPILTTWSAEVSAPTFSSSDPTAAAAAAATDLSQISIFLGNVDQALTETSPSASLSATTLTGYETSISSARTSISSTISALTSAQSALITAKGTLTLAQSGSTPQAIAAQQAQVDEAQAGVASAQANLANTEIVAPISGVLTQQDAKVGQQATPGTPLVSIIGNSGFEVDAGVSDTDVGKLAIGDPVTMTLDAFGTQVFNGTVFYIAPAQTDTGGVISYLVKISFNQAEPQLKSGLTANVNIQAEQDNNVLILPEYAILENNSGTFVETMNAKGVATTTPVTLGIQDQNGNVEVLSGVTEGEQVVNIGLKAQ